MKDKLKSIIERFEELDKLLIDPNVVKNQNQIKKIARERRQLEPIVLKGKKLLSVNHQIEEGQNILSESDEELKNIVKEEFPILESQRKTLEEKLKILMLPHDPNDEKNTIVEVRAGTGGEEAALFAANLYR
ncbi:MAG: PCRF domain-containing protein, partial [Candidatus Marinimicrobia bacterium]|nr:PCRF domain-containing protein [Candidatus Neomarinimicrobiota bacterium]